ncbi:hypothetical protein [Halomonas elongata]|uniref:hypothetical protein n=1 Tax=Halomonas elongata TaxID=2746 RepID=UPI0023B1F508|nr:hypothetical protein [Halomonas elongata]
MTDKNEASQSPSRRRALFVPFFGIAMGLAMFLVSWLAADALELGLVMFAIMLIYTAVMHFGRRFESVQMLAQHPPLDERHAMIQMRAMTAALPIWLPR